MKQGRDTTREERIQIARNCMESGRNYGEMAMKHQVSGIYVNDERVLRICRAKNMKSTIQYASHGCTRQVANSQYLAENLLNRQFHTFQPNEKWLTDVTECKWYEGIAVHKVYLSAILDLYDRRIVAFEISERNDNPLVLKTFDKAVKACPDAHPLFHSDRGSQYTNRACRHKLEQAGVIQSMYCIDDGAPRRVSGEF